MAEKCLTSSQAHREGFHLDKLARPLRFVPRWFSPRVTAQVLPPPLHPSLPGQKAGRALDASVPFQDTAHRAFAEAISFLHQGPPDGPAAPAGVLPPQPLDHREEISPPVHLSPQTLVLLV